MAKFKKFIVFQSDDHYPAGGLGDITGSFDSLPECYEHIAKRALDSNEIVDRDTWEVLDEHAGDGVGRRI